MKNSKNINIFDNHILILYNIIVVPHRRGLNVYNTTLIVSLQIEYKEETYVRNY